MRGDHLVALVVGKFIVGETQYIHLHTGRHQRDNRLLVLRNAGRRMQRDRVPHHIDLGFRNAVLVQEIACRVRAVHFETIGLAAVCRHEPHVMEHRADVEQFRVVLQLLALAGERAEQKDARRVIEEQIGFGVANQLRGVAGHLAVGYPDPGDCVAHVILR